MTTKFYAFFALVMSLTAFPAAAVTFTATAEGNTIRIFSQSDKEDVCNVWVPFSFWHDGKRRYTTTTCPDKRIAISDHVEVCSVTDPVIIRPKIEGPVESKCGK